MTLRNVGILPEQHTASQRISMAAKS